MQCNKCGCERLKVIKVHRNRRAIDNVKYVFSSNTDVRIVACEECNTHYVCNIEKIFAETYNHNTLKKEWISPEKIKIENSDVVDNNYKLFETFN